MNKLPRIVRHVQPRPAESWPSTPEIDGFIWNLGPAPSGPTKASEPCTAENLDDEEDMPDHVYDRRAEEAMVLDWMEQGIRGF